MDDTDTLVVLVQSLLEDKFFETEAILDALVQNDGDPQAAARSLLVPNKRRRVGLDTWLKPPSSKKLKSSTPLSPATASTYSPSSEKLGSNAPTSLTASMSSPSSEKLGINVPTSPIASTSRAPNSRSKPVVDLMSVLKQPPKAEKTVPQLPPLLLSSPALVAEHTPCTLHPSVLPPELACRLFYTMVDASRKWSRNKWWLFDRIVESPHRTSFFARKTNGLDDDASWQEAARFWYNGRMTDVPPVFPPEMEQACRIIECVVNREMRKRTRFPLEWAGGVGDDPSWRANVAASNCYEGGKESVGFHSDQLTYLGPYTTIASLSLGTRRVFSLREVIPSDEVKTRRARTFNIPLTHNSLTIMHASCQEQFKHSIPPQSAIDVYRPILPRSPGEVGEPSNCRINITFRFYRPDFRPASIPRCKCDVPTILRPDMKNRSDGNTDRYWWSCYAGAQNDGKGCNFWQPLDMKAEGRGPVVADRPMRDVDS